MAHELRSVHRKAILALTSFKKSFIETKVLIVLLGVESADERAVTKL